MADSTIDRLAPVYIGEDRFTLTVDPVSKPVLANRLITINVDYSGADPEGVVLPLELVVQPGFGGGGAGNGYKRVWYRRSAPDVITFYAPAAGPYLLLLREVYHNRWQGRLIVEVEGDAFSQAIQMER